VAAGEKGAPVVISDETRVAVAQSTKAAKDLQNSCALFVLDVLL
jgi:hypothetical protein